MKYVQRLNARLAALKLKESKSWIAKKYMLLETEEGDLEINKGDEVILGASQEGDLAIKNPTAILVVSDEALASRIIDAVTNSEDLSDVEFMDKPALDAALDGTSVEDIIAGLSDGSEDSEDIELAMVEPEDDKSVEEKIESISQNVLSTKDALICERAYFAEEEDAAIDLGTMEEPACERKEMQDYETFANEVRNMNGSIQPGEKEVALDAEGKVIGYFDKNENNGVIYPCSFGSEEEMNNYAVESCGKKVVREYEDLADADLDAVDSSLKDYEESAKSVSDLNTLTESLLKAGVKESALGKIANTFVKHNLKEGVHVFDTKLGKVVATFAERVEADNYIAESGNEVRFTKRFFG